MKLFEIAAPKRLYHLTTVRNLLSIFKRGVKEGTSFATNLKSGFFSMMIGNGSVLILLNGKSGTFVKVKNKDGAKELASLGLHSEEYEVRNIERLDASAITEIRIMRGETNPQGEVHYSKDDLNQLMEVAASRNIPVRFVSSKKEFRSQ